MKITIRFSLSVLDKNDNLTGIITESDIFHLVVREWAKLEMAETAV